MQHDQWQSSGTIRYANGNVYEGSWTTVPQSWKCFPGGQGRMTFADGTIYNGTFKCDMLGNLIGGSGIYSKAGRSFKAKWRKGTLQLSLWRHI